MSTPPERLGPTIKRRKNTVGIDSKVDWLKLGEKLKHIVGLAAAWLEVRSGNNGQRPKQ